MRLPMLVADSPSTPPPALVSQPPPRRAGALLCSPVLFYISYGHGQIDAIPTALLFLAVRRPLRGSPKRAGVWLGAGRRAKFHVAAAVRSAECTSSRGPALRTLARCCGLRGGARRRVGRLRRHAGPPQRGYRMMVLHAKEMHWIYDSPSRCPMREGCFSPPAACWACCCISFYDASPGTCYAVHRARLHHPHPARDSHAAGATGPRLFFAILHPPGPSAYAPYWVYNAAYLVLLPLLRAARRAVPRERPRIEGNAPDLALHTMQALGSPSSRAGCTATGVRVHGRYRELHRSVPSESAGTRAAASTRWRRRSAWWSDRRTGAPARATITTAGSAATTPELLTHLNPSANYLRRRRSTSQLLGGFAIQRQHYDHALGKFSEHETLEPNRIILFEGCTPSSPRESRAVSTCGFSWTRTNPCGGSGKIRRDRRTRPQPRTRAAGDRRRESDSRDYSQTQARFADGWSL